jgi:hypothetical protein
MARAKPKFSVLDVQRAMSGAQKAGIEIARCDIRPDGTISIVTPAGAGLDASETESPNAELSPIERWRQKRDARQKSAAQA